MGAKSGLTDLASGLDACIEILVAAHENRTAWKLRRWAMALIRFVSNFPSIEVQMAEAKSYFARCRRFALDAGHEDWGVAPPVPMLGGKTIDRRKILHQISRTSRSLRTATPKVVSDSLEAHFALASDRFETPELLRKSWKQFLRRRFGADVVATFGPVGTAASYLRRLHEGGSSAEVREITDRFRAQELSLYELQEVRRKAPSFLTELVTKVADFSVLEPKVRTHKKARVMGVLPRYRLDTVFFLYDKKSELSEEDWEATREVLFALFACWFEIDWQALPICRQVAVRERGFKVRVATPLQAPFRYLLSVINAALLKKLEEDPRVVSALHGCPAEKLDWSLGVRGNLVFSADLKSATDHFPQDLMMDAADVLSENWPVELRALFQRAVGPHVLFSSQGDRSVTTCRGILMGSPVSWPLLSIYSSWLHQESGSVGWMAVCGDDYIGCHTYPTYRKYLAIRKATGGIGSEGKDFLGHQSVGVFAEELVTVGRCRWVPTVSVRAVLGDPKSGLPAWSQGPEVSEALRRLNLSRRDSGRLCEKLHRLQFLRLRRFRIDPFAPRWIGGAGFPGVPLQASLVRARRMMSQAQQQIIAWVTAYEMAWTTECSSSLLTAAVSEDINRNREFQLGGAEEDGWVPARDVVTSRAASLSWPFYLAGASQRQLRVELRSLSVRILSLNEEIAQRGYWVSSGERVVHGEGLVSALEAIEPRLKPIPFTPILQSLKLFGTSLEYFQARKRSTGPESTTGESRSRKRARLV